MVDTASNKIKLDEIDLAIISNLSQDSRMRFTKMSMATGYPDATIQHRFRRMMKNGVIKRFTIELNPIYVDHGSVSLALLKTISEKHDDVQKKLESLPEVTDIYVVFGEYDFVIKISGKDFSHIDDIMRDKIRVIEGVSELREIAVVEEPKHYHRDVFGKIYSV
ncbi:Lrp/AsnC family transcriptional regulator [Candidatus Marsarchaeota archaeon]|nr:Lrp/AsnC family transcriptional regulator [Candidatus Marsarchaeota archaeon]